MRYVRDFFLINPSKNTYRYKYLKLFYILTYYLFQVGFFCGLFFFLSCKLDPFLGGIAQCALRSLAMEKKISGIQ